MLTCGYGTGWLGINALVVLTMLLIVSFVYLLSRNLPSNARGRLTSLTKSEITQIFISIFILLILFSTTSSLCAITGAVSNSIATDFAGGKAPTYAAGQPFPSLQQPVVAGQAATDPFSYAESYVGQYAFEIGPELGIQIYSYSYAFGVISSIWTQIGNLVEEVVPETPLLNNKQIGPVSVSASQVIGIELGTPYGTLSTEFIDILTPLTVLGTGIMLFQYLILVISDAAAFALLLPIALILRSIAFSGGLIRRAANSILAIAIGLYIIYPVMVVFDSYALSWMFTSCNTPGGMLSSSVCNPSATYLMDTYQLTPFESVDPCAQTTCNVNLYAEGSSQAPISLNLQSILGQLLQRAVSTYGSGGTLLSCSTGQVLSGLFGQAYTQIACYSADQTIYSVQTIMLELSEFLFSVILMFAINVTVTVGFALGLARALDSGVEGAASFWSSL